MTTTLEKDTARSQAAAQYRSICEMVSNLTLEGAARNWLESKTDDDIENILHAGGYAKNWPQAEGVREFAIMCMSADNRPLRPDGFEFNEDDAHSAIYDDALSVTFRSGWYSLNGDLEDRQPSEFAITIVTGGPEVRIWGEIGRHGEPENPRLEYRDWGTSFQPYYGEPDGESVDDEILLTYCRMFITDGIFDR